VRTDVIYQKLFITCAPAEPDALSQTHNTLFGESLSLLSAALVKAARIIIRLRSAAILGVAREKLQRNGDANFVAVECSESECKVVEQTKGGRGFQKELLDCGRMLALTGEVAISESL
jgi:hypothetical protein